MTAASSSLIPGEKEDQTDLSDDETAANIIAENLVFAICGLHSSMGRVQLEASQKFWVSTGHYDQVKFLRAFQLLDPRNGRATFLYLISGASDHSSQGPYGDARFFPLRNLIRTMGKIALRMEHVQMKVVFSTFQKFTSQIGSQESLLYADLLLMPLYKVCEGYAGKDIQETSKHFAQEISESMRGTLGTENFVRVYTQIRKDLKDKRDKRKREEKLMAVVDPARNAKRKLRHAVKSRENKRRKITSMKMQRWMR